MGIRGEADAGIIDIVKHKEHENVDGIVMPLA